MSRERHVQVVREIYEAFGRGDIPAILDRLSEDVEWHEPPEGPPPFGGIYRGRQSVAEFFRRLGESVDVEAFEPREIVPRDDDVIALGLYRFRSRETGRAWETEWVMRWELDDGLVSRFRILKDSAAEAKALAKPGRLVETVRAIYEAFGRGDVPAILERLSDDVEWEHDAADHGIPWLRSRRGREEVARFFETLSGFAFETFEPVRFLENDRQVVAVIRLEAVWKATGRRLRDLEAHLWTFDEEGKVSRLKHFVDTRAHAALLEARASA